MSTLCILDTTGDTRLMWDTNPIEVKRAQERFDELRAKRYLAYRVNKKGDQGEVIDKFDPLAERIILHAPMVGG